MDTPVIIPAPKPFKGCLIVQSGATVNTIPNNTFTVVEFDSEKYDTDGFHESVTNPERITIPAGVKKVRLYGGYGISAGYSRSGFRLHKNGSAFNAPESVYLESDSNTKNYTENFISAVLEVSQGDYFEMDVKQQTGGSSNLTLNNSYFGCEVIE